MGHNGWTFNGDSEMNELSEALLVAQELSDSARLAVILYFTYKILGDLLMTTLFILGFRAIFKFMKEDLR